MSENVSEVPGDLTEVTGRNFQLGIGEWPQFLEQLLQVLSAEIYPFGSMYRNIAFCGHFPIFSCISNVRVITYACT